MTTGTVYLIHFDSPLAHARHYLGWTDNLRKRIKRHRKNRGAAILRACNLAGIRWKVVRTWTGSRELERSLKNRKKTPKFCPVCNPRPKHVTPDQVPVRRDRPDLRKGGPGRKRSDREQVSELQTGSEAPAARLAG